MTIESNSPGGYKQYQDWFHNRHVAISKHGIPDFREELEEIREDIENVPWQKFEPEERIAIANIAMDTLRTVCVAIVECSDNDPSKALAIQNSIATALFNEITLTEGPLNEASWGLVMMNFKDGSFQKNR